MLGLVCGFVIAMVGLVHFLAFDDDSTRPQEHPPAHGPGLAQSGAGVEGDGDDDPAGHFRMMSEGDWDAQAQQRAEARRLATEQRLAQINHVMVWRLADWRYPIAMLQDMIVRLAGMGTSGGSRIAHEIGRNDLALEVELLEPYAEALAAIRTGSSGHKSADPDEARRRATVWHSVWEQLEIMAKVLRESGQIDESGEEQLAKLLREACDTHRALAVMIGNLEDDDAAWAVIAFCNGYLSNCFSPVSHEFFPGQPGRVREMTIGM